MAGAIVATVEGTVADSVLSGLGQVEAILRDDGVLFSIDRRPGAADSGIRLRVTALGDISERHIRQLLNVLSAVALDLGGIQVTLSDDERTFRLPDEAEECEDWFKVGCGGT